MQPVFGNGIKVGPVSSKHWNPPPTPRPVDVEDMVDDATVEPEEEDDDVAPVLLPPPPAPTPELESSPHAAAAAEAEAMVTTQSTVESFIEDRSMQGQDPGASNGARPGLGFATGMVVS